MEFIVGLIVGVIAGGIGGVLVFGCLAASTVKCACERADEAEQHEKEAKEQLNRRMAERIFP